MRVIECNVCGQVLSGATDEELAGAVRRHYDETHPDTQLDEGGIRDLVGQSYEATDS